MKIFSVVLPKKYRLKKKNDFARVLKHGFTLAEPSLILRFCCNQQDLSRAGFVCSKKVAKRAVSRNRIKRCLREVIKGLWLDIKPGYDIVFFTRPGIANKDFAETMEVVEKLLKKARLVNKN